MKMVEKVISMLNKLKPKVKKKFEDKHLFPPI